MYTQKRTPKIILTLLLTIGTLALVACGSEAPPEVQVLRDQAAVETSATEVPSEEMGSVGPEPESANEPAHLTVVDETGSTSIDTDALDVALAAVPDSGALTPIEAEGLLFMREEEKLARDVYLTLYDRWNLNIFQNIAASEQTHTDAVKTLLEQYGLEDPMATDARGVFENPDLQALYDQLVEQGGQSSAEALNVGAAIEEIDILDLETYIAQTDQADIQMVYENLMKGSRNHLRSFVNTLQRQVGATYQPQYLSQDAYQAIIGSDIESGGNGNGRGNRGGNGRGNGGGKGFGG